MDSDICGIYKIQNLINGKIYIGQSIHIYQRWKEHLRLAKKKKTNFYKDLKKYGEECFS